MHLKIKGMDALEQQLSTLENAAPGIAKACLYEGARVVADSVRAAVASIPEQEHHAVPRARNGAKLVYLTPEEKAACLAGIGIAKFSGSGDLFETAVGFSGYQSISGNSKGVAVPMLIRSIEIGTSVRAKHPVIRKAYRGAESGAFAAMKAKFDELIDNIMK